MASDPDAARVGAAVKNNEGEWVLLNGNQTALMFVYYLITRWKELGKINGKEYIVKTIVTTETIKTIAERNGVEIYDVYTGFKWIAISAVARKATDSFARTSFAIKTLFPLALSWPRSRLGQKIRA